MKVRLLFALALLLPRLALAQTYGGPLCGLTPSASRCVTGIADVINVKDYGAKGDGVADDTAAIRAAAALLPTTGGGHLHFPAGNYNVTDTGNTGCALPILQQQSLFTGDGPGASVIQQPLAVQAHGYDILCNITPRTCTGGTGNCDATFATSLRGAGCVCARNLDCQSGTCAGGTAKRNGHVSDMRLLLRQVNSRSIDMTGLDGWTFSSMMLSTTAAATGNSEHVVFNDGNGAMNCYDNTFFHVGISGAPVHFYPTANHNQLIEGTVSNTVGTAITIDAVNSTLIEGEDIQTNCTGGGTCYDISNGGSATRIVLDRFEDSNATEHVHNTAAASGTMILDNFHTGTAAFVGDAGSSRPSVDIFTASSDTAKDWLLLSRTPWTARGLASITGVTEWTWQSRNLTTTIDSIGMDAPVVTGTASSAVSARGRVVTLTSAAGAGSFAGLTPAGALYNAFQFQERPNFVFGGEIGSITNERVWIGLFSGDPTGSSTPALSYTAFRFSKDGVVDDGTTWKACQDSGSGTPTCIDTGITAAIQSALEFMIQTGTLASNVVSPTYWINGLRVGTSTATVPAGTTPLHAVATVTTTTGAKFMQLRRLTCTSPNIGT